MSRASKIRRRLRAKEKIANHREQQTVHYQLSQRVKGAQNNVECDPNKQKPARPVAATEDKHSAKNREKPDQANPQNVILKRAACLELGGVVGKSDDACSYEQPADDRD